jgi:F-type H+-transporting ATPase subunit delta
VSDLKTLARPYAEAVFKLAQETGRIDQWSRMLEFLATVMADREMAWAAANPKVGEQAFLRLILEVGKGYLDREGENFVKLLVHSRRITLIDQIRELFEQYRAEHEGYMDVKVITAYPLSEEDRASLVAELEKNLGKKIRLSSQEDADLIGGVVIRAGDKVIDGSVRGQLERLAKRLLA